MDIKNTLEVFDTLDALAKAVLDAKADGKVNYLDAPKLGPVVSAALKAVDGSELVVPELKELDEKEIATIVVRANAAIKALVVALGTAPAKK